MTSSDSLPEWARALAVFDTETTGVDVSSARIVSAHVSVIGPDGEVSESRDWLINPGVPIPEVATAVHGITNEMAKEQGSSPPEAIFDIVAVLTAHLDSGLPLVAYNAPFDLSILKSESLRHDVRPLEDIRPVIDPLIIDRHVDRYRKGKRTLDDVAAFYGIAFQDQHTASADAVAAGRVAQALARKYADQLDVSALELHDAQVVWAREQAESLAAYLKSQGRTSFRGSGAWPIR